MKKYLCILFVVFLFLNGCTGKKAYYPSLREAFMAGQENKVTFNREFDVIELGNGLVIYVAITTDIVRSGCVTATVMEKEKGSFRIAENGKTEFCKLSEITQREFSDSAWSHFVTEDGNSHYMWQWVTTEKVPENNDGAYTFKSYELEYAGTDYGVTLVLYTI